MRKLRIFVVELILVGILLGVLFVNYPHIFDRAIPWIMLIVLWHLTWECFVQDKHVKSLIARLFCRHRRLAWGLSLVFVVGVSLGFWYGTTAIASSIFHRTVTLSVRSEIVARVHERAMWLATGQTEVYAAIFQDLFHEWVITVTPTREATHAVVTIRDARLPLDKIQVMPMEDGVVSETKKGWMSGFEEPSQTPDFYIRTVSFETLTEPAVITIRRPIKSRNIGATTINTLDLDLDRIVSITVANSDVVTTPVSDVNMRFQVLTDQLQALLSRKAESGATLATRLDPDEPYPPLLVNQSEIIDEVRCASSPCKTVTITLQQNPRKIVNVP
jgi:hypothetical protein